LAHPSPVNAVTRNIYASLIDEAINLGAPEDVQIRLPSFADLDVLGRTKKTCRTER
jgi:hypothetical protein